MAFFEGHEFSTVTTSALTATNEGVTRIPITAFTGSGQRVQPGDLVRITSGGDTFTVRSRGLFVNDVPYLDTSPIPRDVADGATVTIDQRCLILGLNNEGQSSENGVIMENADVFNANFSETKWTGRHLGKMYNSSLQFVGEIPPVAGRVTPKTSNRSFWLDEFSSVTGINPIIRLNDNVIQDFYLKSNGAQRSSLTMLGGFIEEPSTLHNGADPVNQVQLFGTRTLLGKPIDKPVGAWVPDLTFANAKVGMTTTIDLAEYSLDGNIVRLDFDVTMPAKGSSTGQLELGNLPYPPENGTPSIVSITQGVLAYAAPVVVLPISGELRFYQQTTTGMSSVTEARLADGARIFGTITYRTAL